MTGEQQRVIVRAIAAGGDGVATMSDGRTVFVPRAAPGDQLVLRDLRRHARFARASIATIEVAGPGRVEPPCPHYVIDRCGSCQLMHLGPEVQRFAKARIAGDALRRIARLDVADPEMTASPDAFGYRSKVTFTIQGGRIGYFRLDDPTRVFDVRECLIANGEVRELHRTLRAAREHLPRDNARVALRIDRDGGRHVLVTGTTAGDVWTGGIPLQRAMARAGVTACVWWQPVDGTARAVAGAADPWPATVFEQVHPAMGREVRAAALAAIAPVSGRHVWDLYAGVGDTTAVLAMSGATVESVEGDRQAVRLAEQRGPAGPQRIAGRVEDVIGRLAAPAAVITNPPRAGMGARVVDALSRSGAECIAYISCDPATLARDVARLAAAYRVSSVRAFDQFPQTAHLECLALLEHA